MKSGVSLQQMLTEVKRQSESKEDYLIEFFERYAFVFVIKFK